ncbi:MAG: OmpA family protein [Gammaproteobacteria bacterium]
MPAYRCFRYVAPITAPITAPIAAVIVALGLGACANDPYQRTKIGAAAGAVAGAVIGHQLDDDAGRYVGGAIGALAGAGVGYYMDEQEQAFERELAEEQRRNELEVERLRDDTLKLSLDSEVSFDFGSAALKPAFTPTLDKLVTLLGKYDRTVVHVVGHTDSVGSVASNLTLSKRRADAVGNHLLRNGIASQRVRTEGRGESEPRDSNSTEAGRQLNRRVEIYVKPIVQGQEEKAYEAPHYTS